MSEDNKESVGLYIPMNFDDQYEMKFSSKELKDGVKYGSYLGGIVSCLFNSGLKSNEIAEIICKIIENKKET